MKVPRWQFMTRYDIPSRINPDETYLTRWRVIQTPWFGVYVHRIREPDTDRHLHDHPWSFFSLVLWGGYVEEMITRTVKRGFLSWAFRKASAFHRITKVRRGTTTLFLIGRKKRTWGFLTPTGWVRYRDYFQQAQKSEPMV